MTYIGDSRQEFYGINQFKLLAEHFPQVEFKLFGVKKPIVELPSNVKVFGWVSADEFQSQLRSTPIFLRLTEHDGFSLSVIEALSYGCEVMWTFPYEYSYQATSNEELILTFDKLQQLILNRGLTPNQDSINVINRDYSAQAVFTKYVEKVKAVVGK
jgi:glycosyltransferase involved in cell wall biosynthesis